MTVSIMLINPKNAHNVGSSVRAVSCFGGGSVYYTGDRVDLGKRLPREERMKAYSATPWSRIPGPRPIDTVKHLHRDVTLTPVAVELLPGSESLHLFDHPDDTLYVFGPEDGSIPAGLRRECHRFVTIPSLHCLNLSAAVYLVLYDRIVKRAAAGLDVMPTIEGEARGWWHSPALEEDAFS